MFKITRHGIAILMLALSFITGTANANFNYCNSAKPGTTGYALCGLAFLTIPSFANMCLLTIQSGVYTVTNNSPIAITITSIQIQNNDALPNIASAIVTAPTNNCVVGTTLAPSTSCNIQVNLLPLAFGTYNRTLLIGTDTRQVALNAPPINSIVSTCLPPAPAPIPPNPFFPGGFNFTILAGSTVTNTGLSVVNGNVGVSPGSAITGFPPGTITNGTTHAADAVAAAAQLQLTTAYNNLAAQPCGTNLTGQDLGPPLGLTLPPGVYCFNSSAQLTGALTLSGAGTYIFQVASALTTGPGANVTLINGATSANVYWQIGSSATLGTTTFFQGNIVALTSITLNTGATLLGRALARNGAVTLATNGVNPS